MKKILIISTALCGMVLSGCSVGEAEKKQHEKVSTVVDAGLSRLSDRNSVRAGGSQFSEGIFVGASPERNNSALLPSRLQSSGAVRLESRDALTLEEISQRLSEITGIPHILALGPTGRLRTANAEVLTASDVSSTTPGYAAPGDPRAAPPPVTRAPVAAASEESVTMRPNLRGSLSEVLDQVTNTFDVEWSYSDGRVLFRDFVTRKYQITALPGTSGGSTSISANSISSESTLNSDIWGEVEVALNGIVSEGANVSIGSTTGLVTVTARVADQNRVAEYVKQINGVIGQQVSFDVNVFTVALNDERSAGIDLTSALSQSSLERTMASGDSDVGDVNIGIIRGTVTMDAVARALSSQGKVSVAQRAGATTSNNRVAPINVIDRTAYLKEVSITDDGDGRERIQRTTDEVETGFQMQLFPRVMNNRELMVQFTVHLSELNNMAVFGEGNEAVQLPEVSTTSFEQQAVLENGQTLILAGFERNRVTLDDNVGGRALGVVAAGRTATTNRVATVMMITPRIISRN